MVAIDRGRIGIALVVAGGGRLLGIVTDGDLRRAMLAGKSLDAPINQAMNTHYTYVTHDATSPEILRLMQEKSIKQIPMVDENHCVAAVCLLPDLIDISLRPNWAVIMAGGEGRRLRPLTEQTPKPMLPVANRPLLENTVSLLVGHGFRELFISVNYLGDAIKSYFGDGRQFACHISYLQEKKPMGTAGGLSLLPEKPAIPLLVVNGDLLTDVNLSALMEWHNQADCIATQCIREYSYQIPFGVVTCENGRVVHSEEKPLQRALINAGIYVLSPQLLEMVPVGQELPMTELLAEARSAGHKVAAYPIQERWMDIGRLEDYRWAQENWVPGEGR
jgi:dTDP-glucose pyrophosphorylase